MAAKELGIVESRWLEKARDRIREIKPGDESLDLKWDAWKPVPKPAGEQKQDKQEKIKSKTGSSTGSVSMKNYDGETKRVLKRINNIMDMTISQEDKIKQLNRIELDANRDIEFETQKINELKAKIQ